MYIYIYRERERDIHSLIDHVSVNHNTYTYCQFPCLFGAVTLRKNLRGLTRSVAFDQTELECRSQNANCLFHPEVPNSKSSIAVWTRNFWVK